MSQQVGPGNTSNQCCTMSMCLAVHSTKTLRLKTTQLLTMSCSFLQQGHISEDSAGSPLQNDDLTPPPLIPTYMYGRTRCTKASLSPALANMSENAGRVLMLSPILFNTSRASAGACSDGLPGCKTGTRSPTRPLHSLSSAVWKGCGSANSRHSASKE